MAPHFTQARRWNALGDDRPIAFLVSTTPAARGIRDHMGSPAYSYYFVVEALAPVLERLGAWRLIDHPESRLAYAAKRAEAEGFRPVHLAVNPLQDVYLSPEIPNIVFPFWEFPEIPDRDFGHDTRQNWLRICRGASMVLTACRFTADAFLRAGVQCPVSVVPIPLAPEAFHLPDWQRCHSLSLHCRHEVLAPAEPKIVRPALGAAPAESPEKPPKSLGEHAFRQARSAFRRVSPWLKPHTVARLTLLKQKLARASRMSPGKLAFVLVRNGYRNNVRRWLSNEALLKISDAKKAALALVGREPHVVPDPPLPSGPLFLGNGLTYLTIFNLGDRRKNWLDMISAFLLAFRDRDDVTLVIKMVTNVLVESFEAGVLRSAYQNLGISHRCRVVVITEYLDQSQMDALFQVATCYVNASHAEGACLPLLRALAGGRPAIAPDHTAMADYMDASVGFVPRSFPEPAYWPHDPDQHMETYRYRPVWSDIRDAFLASAGLAETSPILYAAMAQRARERMAQYAGRDVAEAALRTALKQDAFIAGSSFLGS